MDVILLVIVGILGLYLGIGLGILLTLRVRSSSPLNLSKIDKIGAYFFLFIMLPAFWPFLLSAVFEDKKNNKC